MRAQLTVACKQILFDTDCKLTDWLTDWQALDEMIPVMNQASDLPFLSHKTHGNSKTIKC